MMTLLPPPLSHSPLRSNSASSNTNSHTRTPLVTAALLAILTLHSAHALPTSSNGTSSTLDLSSSIAEQFPAPLDPGLQYDQTYTRTEDAKTFLTSVSLIDAPGRSVSATDAARKLNLKGSDLKGCTWILSAGWTYLNEPGTFSCEFDLNGYAGTRNGVSGRIQETWKF